MKQINKGWEVGDKARTTTHGRKHFDYERTDHIKSQVVKTGVLKGVVNTQDYEPRSRASVDEEK